MKNPHISRPESEPPFVTTEELMPAGGLPARAPSSEDSDPKLKSEPFVFDSSAHKFELEPSPTDGPHPAPPAYEHLGDLPSSYGTRKLYLTARDPFWLFSYWDLSFDQLAEAERQAHDGKVFLQIYTANGDRIQQIHITPWAREWMIHANRPNNTFYAEIGYYRYDGTFEVLTRSKHATSPRDNLSENNEVRFVTIPFKLSFAELRALVEHLAKEGEALAETLSRLQEEGYPLPFDHHAGTRLSEDERRRVLETLGGTDILRRTWIDSQEIVERFSQRFQLRAADSSGQWPPSSHWLSGSSPSSPFGGRSRGFFMHLNAELIIYGGTDPDATLRIDGKSIQLDEHGNFHFHFNFPDGTFHIPVQATSADGVETRSALLSFLRLTDTAGEVLATPQPPNAEPLGRLK